MSLRDYWWMMNSDKDCPSMEGQSFPGQIVGELKKNGEAQDMITGRHKLHSTQLDDHEKKDQESRTNPPSLLI